MTSDRLYFDIETDGIDATTVHCVVTIDDDSVVRRYRKFDGSLEEGLACLQEADEVVGHNIIGYDIPVLERLHGCIFDRKVVDTYVLAALMHAHVSGKDYANKRFPKKLAGKHTLEAWGYRLGVRKDDYGKQQDAWDKWTPELEDYCEQDVWVTRALFLKLRDQGIPSSAFEMEQEFFRLMEGQRRHGFWFDRQAAECLYARLMVKRDELKQQLVEAFEPTIVELKTKTKVVPFNPGSRQQIADRLMRLGWKPKEFAPSGHPKIDETTLEALAEKEPKAAMLNEFLLLQKRIGQLAEGKQAWLKMVGDDQRMHGRVITVGGTVSHRCAHASPNMAQVPAVRSPYGTECRSLFAASPGRVLVGCDVSGLELRVLAHYLARWDGGSYVKAVCEGDIHTHNQKAAGCTTRDQAKTFIYAFIYGAWNEKLGSIVGGGAREGAALRRKFLRALPALKHLMGGVYRVTKTRGWLKGIDGRRLYPRSQHSALNLLIQSTGALVVKQATITFVRLLEEAGLVLGEDFALVAHIHDEWQTECAPEHVELVKAKAVEAIVLAGEHYGLRCPLTGEAKAGRTWADTH